MSLQDRMMVRALREFPHDAPDVHETIVQLQQEAVDDALTLTDEIVGAAVSAFREFMKYKGMNAVLHNALRAALLAAGFKEKP